MTLEQKKEHILRCVKLGMELFKAEIYAQCTEEDIETLSKDDAFLKSVDQQYAVAEYHLLLEHSTASEIAKNKGNAGPVQWKLSRLNPNRWGSKEKVVALKTPQSIEVNLKGKSVDGN